MRFLENCVQSHSRLFRAGGYEMPATVAGNVRRAHTSPPSLLVQKKIRVMAALAKRKESSLRKKTMRFARGLRHAHLRPPSLLSLYSKKTQQEMLTPLAHITCKLERKCELYAALSNYCKLHSQSLALDKLSKKEYQALSREMQAAPEGYFFYKNVRVGVSKYARAKGLVDDETTADTFFALHDTKAMLVWIRDGFE